jgi:hypothetical protein
MIGRFIGIDPVDFHEGNIHSFNRYAYANNNTYRYIDPDGAQPIDGTTSYYSGLNSNEIAPAQREVGRQAIVGGASMVGGASAGRALGGWLGRMLGSAGSRKALDAGAKQVTKEAGRADDFFKGTKYTDKVKMQMKQGDFHSFPESVRGFQDAGRISKIKGGDGVVRHKLDIPGGYRGREGRFEFIKEPDGKINHRLFQPD